MTNAPESFDWSSLGDAPLLGEISDDAMLDAVLLESSIAPVLAPATAPPRWIRPAVVAAVLLAAAVVLVFFAPSWSEALLSSDEHGSLAPDVEAAQEDDEAVRKQAKRKAATATKSHVDAPPAEPEDELLIEDEPSDESPAKKVQPVASADELLRLAQDALAAKNTAGAIRKYGALVRHHPRSAQARTARVSLGRLQLSAGRAKKALAQFDRYLDGPGGGLRREAELGRIDALRKLGRASAQKRAIEAFLKAHPNTVHAGRLRKQLETLP